MDDIRAYILGDAPGDEGLVVTDRNHNVIFPRIKRGERLIDITKLEGYRMENDGQISIYQPYKDSTKRNSHGYRDLLQLKTRVLVTGIEDYKKDDCPAIVSRTFDPEKFEQITASKALSEQDYKTAVANDDKRKRAYYTKLELIKSIQTGKRAQVQLDQIERGYSANIYGVLNELLQEENARIESLGLPPSLRAELRL